VCRYKDFHLFIFPSANIIERAEAHSPGLRAFGLSARLIPHVNILFSLQNNSELPQKNSIPKSRFFPMFHHLFPIFT
ncbi:hypothetical protein, partial [Segatella copri]|uniref:hypothetical protein n=1 Tax=Segatella copri TaxID=165179 RepID=UPI001D176B60